MEVPSETLATALMSHMGNRGTERRGYLPSTVKDRTKSRALAHWHHAAWFQVTSVTEKQVKEISLDHSALGRGAGM